jgi:hypothetical protein
MRVSPYLNIIKISLEKCQLKYCTFGKNNELLLFTNVQWAQSIICSEHMESSIDKRL